tara:strand:- start:635 stop:1030 length:396 start_codon:yes stop_codon:yes gene_type:complete
MKKHWVLPSIIVAFGLNAVVVHADDGALIEQQIRDIISGQTGEFVARDGSVVTAYFESDGTLKGDYKKKEIDARWWIAEDQLCFDLPQTADDGCWTVVHRHGLHLQLYTYIGRPVTALKIRQKNLGKNERE